MNYVEVGRFGPKSAVSADNRGVVDETRCQELLVDVVLPAHFASGLSERNRCEQSEWTRLGGRRLTLGN